MCYKTPTVGFVKRRNSKSFNKRIQQTQKKYKTRHDRMGKVIHWELCKKSKFDHITKWYMHKAESILKNEMHKILCNFETQMGHLILVGKPDLEIYI